MREVTHWEYRRRAGHILNEMDIMREMGEEGWELCGVWFALMYFKRPIGSGR